MVIVQKVLDCQSVLVTGARSFGIRRGIVPQYHVRTANPELPFVLDAIALR